MGILTDSRGVNCISDSRFNNVHGDQTHVTITNNYLGDKTDCAPPKAKSDQVPPRSAKEEMSGGPLDLSGKIEIEERPDKIGPDSELFVGRYFDPDHERLISVGVKMFLELGIWNTYYELERRRLKSSSIVPLIGTVRIRESRPAIVMPYYSDGNVVQHVNKKPRATEEKLKLVQNIIQGLEYLHSEEIVHGNLHGTNVLMDSKEPGNPKALVADYGLIPLMSKSPRYDPKRRARWTAPELISSFDKRDYNGPDYTTASDVFAFGMTTIEVFTGKVPFASIKDEEVWRKISEGERPRIPLEIIKELPWLAELLRQCWDQDPSARPSTDEIKNTIEANLCQQGNWLQGVFRYAKGLMM